LHRREPRVRLRRPPLTAAASCDLREPEGCPARRSNTGRTLTGRPAHPALAAASFSTSRPPRATGCPAVSEASEGFLSLLRHSEHPDLRRLPRGRACQRLRRRARGRRGRPLSSTRRSASTVRRSTPPNGLL